MDEQLESFDQAREKAIEMALVRVSSLADSSINIAVMPWVLVPDYPYAAGEISKAIVEAFRERGIAIPFPQREVRVLGGEPSASGDAPV